MDPEFLLSLMNNADSVNIAELLTDYIRKDEIIPLSSLPSEYFNGINNELDTVKNNIVDITENYRQKSVTIKLEDLDKDLQDLFNGMLYFLQHVKKQDDVNPVITYSENGERVIIVIDNEGNEYNVVIPVFYDTDSSVTIDQMRLEAQINNLQNQVNNLTSTVNALKRQMSGVGTATAVNSYSVNLGSLDLSIIENDTVRELLSAIISQASKISKLEDSLYALTEGNDDISLNMISSRLAQCEYAIDSLESNSSRRIQMSDLNTELQQKINTITDIERRTALVENNKMNVPVLKQSGYLYFSTEEGQTLKSRPPIIKATLCETSEDIVTAQSNKEKFIINLQTGEGYQFNSVNKAYDIIQIEKNPEYEFSLFLNTETETVDHFVLNGTLMKINSSRNLAAFIGSTNITVKRVNVVSGSNYRTERLNNLKKFPPLILVYDFEENSRTAGQYINAEGVVTVSHDAEGFTVYNDSLYELELLIMAGD